MIEGYSSYLLCFLNALMLLTNSGSSVVTRCVLNIESDTFSCVVAEPCETTSLNNLTTGVDEYEEIVVYLCSSSYFLDNSAAINFTDKKRISIIGQADGSSLNCHDNNTGLYFRNVSTLTVEHITLSHCGLSISEDYKMTNLITCSFYVKECIHISMTYVSILNSSGAGLALVNNSGIITITDSSFYENGPSLKKHGSGLAIYSTKQHSQYNITRCSFVRNNYLQGSGLNVQLRGQSHDINMSIVDCSFIANSAMHGGAMYTAFLNNSHDILLNISKCKFSNNKAVHEGVTEDRHSGCYDVRGGAMYVDFRKSSHDIIFMIRVSFFSNNKAISDEEGVVESGHTAMHGGAIYISFRDSHNISLKISQTIFGKSSFNSTEDGCYNNSDANTAERGGAIYIVFLKSSGNITLVINQSSFGNINKNGVNAEQGPNICAANTAMCGGAMYIAFLEKSNNITLTISQSIFSNNIANYRGGAIEAGYYETPDNQNFVENSIQVISCNFIDNRAELGGGLYLCSYSDSHHFKLLKNFTFVNCRWIGNSASSSGSAIYAVTHDEAKFNDSLIHFIFIKCSWLRNNATSSVINVANSEARLQLILMFSDCTFNKNSPNNSRSCIEKNSKGKILQTSYVLVILSGIVEFADNFGSAIYSKSSILEISSYTEVAFTNNQGLMGGAVRMQDYSNISMHDNSIMTFTDNSACFYSGAIYYDDSSKTSGRKCFIDYADKRNAEERNTTLYFYNNTVLEPSKSNSRVSIFAASILPSCGPPPALKTLNSIADFININSSMISTFANKIKLPEDSLMHVIPGKETDVIFLDEVNNEVEEPFDVVKFNSTIIECKVLNLKTLILLGKPVSNASLTLQLKHKKFELNIFLEHCPPGYVLNRQKSCECSTNTQFLYLGIECNPMTYQAKLLHGFWAGYVGEIVSDETFRTSDCPLGYCSNESDEIFLPGNANSTVKKRLNSLVCSKNHTGRVCGKCEENTSMLFHTQGTFDCGNNEKYHCKYGILLYIISEIIPATVLFVLIILLDVQLTTGAFNSFLFYAQIFSTLIINADSSVTFPKGVETLLEVLNFILSFFNLNFFLHPKLSFCLFKGATFFHVTLFDYITVVYALLLVLFMIAVLSSNFFFRTVRLRKTSTSKSIIHGLSGFLVICYARYTHASIRILIPTTLYGKGAKAMERVLYYYGEVDFFSPDHLPYAIPAFILIIMTLMPPLLLIFFPLYYKTLSLLKMEESRFTKLLCKVVPLEKLMPFFDSFQGSFKDKYRYFAGLYFIYRISAWLLYSIADTLATFYGMLSLQFILTLGFHAWIKPYKNKWHNRLDIYIFTVLCVINGISMLNYEHAMNRMNHQYIIHLINVLSTVQVLLAYTPLLIMLVYLIVRVWPFMAKKCTRKFHYRRERSESDLTLSMIDQSRDTEYMKCK